MRKNISRFVFLIKGTFIVTAMLAVWMGSVDAQSTTIARVGQQDFSVEKIRSFLDGISASERAALEKDPAVLNQTVRTLILQQLLFKEAVDAGWDKQPEVTARLDRMRQAMIADSYLKEVSRVPDGYPSEDEIKSAYEARKASLVIPRQVRIAQIFVSMPDEPSATEKAKTRVGDIQRQLKQSGADFGAIARAVSDEPESAARGGEIGWIAQSALQPEIRERVAIMAKGSVSDPVKLGDGWYFVRLEDSRESRTAAYEEVRLKLREALQNERVRLNGEAYLAKLNQQNPISLNELSLTELLAPGKK